MPFKLEVLRGATAYTISDGAPFRFEEADLGGAAIRNIEESGPSQDGVTNLAQRLDPTTLTLNLSFHASTPAILDGYRDTLTAMFKPVVNVPVTLRLTRDDGGIRNLDTHLVRMSAPLVKEHRPGNLHKVVVQLRAAGPTWYNPTQKSSGFTPPSGSWWLGLATIGSANVLTHVENPTQGQLFAHTGSVAAGSAWTVAFRSSFGTPTVFPWLHAFDAHPPSFDDTNYRIYAEGPGVIYTSGTVGNFAPSMNAGTSNYFMVMEGTAISYYIDGVLYNTDPGTTAGLAGTAGGTARWRSNYANDVSSRWPVALPNAAVYNIALSPTQRTSLNAAMNSAGSAPTAYSAPIVYLGDVDSYPVITMTGPIADPVITNTTTGDTLNFTGGTLGSADIWIVDTRYGRKSALSGTTSVEQYLSGSSNLSTFRLVADPLATGGTNTITVNSSDAGTAAIITVAYYDRYLNF